MDFQKTNHLASLLDFYGTLLTDKQRQVAQMFLYDNLGIVEIAQVCNTTKQAINDLLKRTEKILENYELKMRICEKFSKSTALLENKELKQKFIKIWEQ